METINSFERNFYFDECTNTKNGKVREISPLWPEIPHPGLESFSAAF